MSGRTFNAKAIRAIMGIIAFVVFPLASWAEPVDETPEFSCSINGQIEDADGNSYEIRGLLEIYEYGQVRGYYYYESTMRKYGDKPSTYIKFTGIANVSDKANNAYDIVMTAKYYKNPSVEKWKGILYIGSEESSFDGTMTGKAGDKYQVNFVGDNIYLNIII